jgi:hypothetical protein
MRSIQPNGLSMSLTEEEKTYIKEEEELLETTLKSLCQQLPVAQNAKISC